MTDNIRNFAIVAHVDHGKSTLADRLLEATKTIQPEEMKDQYLDSNPIERERGITIKLTPVRMRYELPQPLKKIFNFQFSIFNLIDTPGHVDFSYEVSRSLAACEGVLLLVDSTQGIQAQTLLYMKMVREKNLTVVAIINKIDSPFADIAKAKKQLTEIFGFNENEIIQISAKKGINVDKVLEAIVLRIPPPYQPNNKPLRALIFSSVYDKHHGVIVYVKVVDGQIDISKKKPLIFLASKAVFTPLSVGYFNPRMVKENRLTSGQVGFVSTGLKDVRLTRVGDTITEVGDKNGKISINPLPGYQKPKPMVFFTLYPLKSDNFAYLQNALERLSLQDSAFSFKVVSTSLGKGFNLGFLGLLHAEVVQERLKREFNAETFSTYPSVEYQLELTDGREKIVRSSIDFPKPETTKKIKEPIMQVSIYSPQNHLGKIMKLARERRANLIDIQYFAQQVKLSYFLPLSEMIVDFYDKLKSATSGYATLEYEFYSYEEVDVVKLDILINSRVVDALSSILVRQNAQKEAKYIVDKLASIIPRQQFQVVVQAAIGSKIIARSDIKPFRKDVTAKLYGGDRTRKDKLLKKQKKGKKKMKMLGRVQIPPDAFMAVFRK